MSDYLTKNKIEAGNALIADFMGIILTVNDGYQKEYEWLPHPGHSNWCFHSPPPYDRSWNWMMDVLHKLSYYHYPEYYGTMIDPKKEGEYEDTPWLRTFGMRDAFGHYMVRINAMTVHTSDTLIRATWDAVIEFIEWYNAYISSATIKDKDNAL